MNTPTSSTDFNPYLKERMIGLHQMLMGAHAAGAGMSANTRGNEREDFLSKFLERVLPPTYRFGTGDATDVAGERSGQLDIVIEHPFAPSVPLGTGSGPRLYPAEAIAAVIEVKSDLASQWSEFTRTLSKLKPLERRLGASMSVGGRQGPEIPIFAVGYRGWRTADTIRQKAASDPSIAGVLIIEDKFYANGKGHVASGDRALWMFICEIHAKISGLIAAQTNPYAYMGEPITRQVTVGGVNPFATVTL